MANPTSLTPLEKAINVTFRDKDLLALALTHRSAARHQKREGSTIGSQGHNERLEFLGDAVLELAVTEFLFAVSDKPEGELTNWRSALVRGEELARIAQECKLGEFLFLSRGEESSGGREKESTLANALEALIGAMYLDQGWEVTREFVNTFVIIRLKDILAKGGDRDAKSTFQEMSQDQMGITPTYKVMNEVGPDHDKIFTVAVCLDGKEIAKGEGASKQKAEQDAAEKGLKEKGWERK